VNQTRQIVLHSIAVIFFIGAIYAAYLPGLTGPLYYDDYANLEGLSSVQTGSDMYHFVRDGQAGPLGRPIALATFLPHAAGWPENSASILRGNVVIHIFNALLLIALGTLILRLRGHSPQFAFWIAFAAALLWASLPLLASTTLIAIQRMASLATTFSLLGLIGYVAAHRYYPGLPVRAWLLSMGALAAGTVLGMLTKESAALTPVFALVIGLLLLPQPPRSWRVTRDALLWFSLIAILLYLSPLQRDWFTVIDFRGWSPWERLQTQSVLLWEYLRLLAFPLPNAFSPFHDHYPLIAHDPRVALATAGWAAAFGLSGWIYYRRGIVWPLFALSWFLVGHLLESSTIGLELKFEHRNYLAVYGFALALAVGAFSLEGRWRVLAPAFLATFIFLQMAVLAATTSLWGQPQVAANTWSERNPASARAVIHLVLLEPETTGIGVAEGNIRFIDHQRRLRSLELMDRTLTQCPDCIGVHLDALNHSCHLTRPEDTLDRLERVTELARAGHGRSTELRSTIDSLFRLRDRANANQCPPLEAKDLLPLTLALDENDYFARSHTRGRLRFLSAALAEDAGDIGRRDAFLELAESIAPEALPILQYQVYSALREERHGDALAAIDRRRATNVPGGAMSDDALNALEAEVLEDTDRPFGTLQTQ
jgi:hypothetical protein